jgi:hypothetical protein
MNAVRKDSDPNNNANISLKMALLDKDPISNEQIFLMMEP